MQRQVVQLGLSAIATTVLASSAWAAATPWTPNTSGNVGAAPTTFNKWEAIEAPAESGASCGNGTPYRTQKVDGYEVTPDGNAVSLEDQMMKVTSNQMDYQTVTSLYQRSLGLLKTAVGKK